MEKTLTDKKIESRKRMAKFKKDYIGYRYMAPFLILFIIFTAIPIVYSFTLTFFNYNGLQPPRFVGLDNYKFLFLRDNIFPVVLKNTFVFAILLGPASFILSFLVAVMLNKMKHKQFMVIAFYAPTVAGNMSVIWLWLFSNDQYGLINNFLMQYGFLDSPILWNQDPKYIYPIVLLISLWGSMGGGFLVFYAGLQSLGTELYEQGKIDGIKGAFQELIYITLPQMKPQLLFGLVTVLTGSFGVYEIPALVAGFPSPNYSADTMVGLSYDYAFTRFQFGYSAVLSLAVLFITFTLGKISMKILKSD